jgi:hypothetical protein
MRAVAGPWLVTVTVATWLVTPLGIAVPLTLTERSARAGAALAATAPGPATIPAINRSTAETRAAGRREIDMSMDCSHGHHLVCTGSLYSPLPEFAIRGSVVIKSISVGVVGPVTR